MDTAKDPYGRFDMPAKEKEKKYFSLLTPFKVTIYFYFLVLRQMFIQQLRDIAAEEERQQKLSSYERTDKVLFMFFFWLFQLAIVFGGLAITAHFLVPVFCINGYLMWLSAVVFIVGTFFSFHLHTDDGFLHWKNKLLGEA